MDLETQKSTPAKKGSEDAVLIEMRMRLSELDNKVSSLLLADKYHRIFHAIYISMLLVFILFQ